ncbi:MAG TPA: NUDIX hydrolase [Candidatus Dormibacteraeota bacterium]|nr:NUDIX hydrolase [Candidatus Dormibacteraeota bacterium]
MVPHASAVEHLRESPVSRRDVYAGRLLRVFEDEVRLDDGTLTRREVVEHRGAVAIVAADDSGRVVLVRQWRHAVGGTLWEIPAGTREIGEEAEATARRELAEETGYVADTWRFLARAAVSPGYSSELIGFYLATGLHPGTTRTDADERIDTMLATPAEVAELVRAGQCDCKTVGGLALAGRLPDLTAAVSDGCDGAGPAAEAAR